MMRHSRTNKLELLLGTIIILIMTVAPACQSPFSPLKDLDRIAESVVVNGVRITMDCFLYRNLMPTTEPEFPGLTAVITLTAEGASVFPENITGDRLYVAYEENSWETPFDSEIRPVDAVRLNKIQLVAHNGPKWPVGSRVDVVVRLAIKGGGYLYIKALDQVIGAVY